MLWRDVYKRQGILVILSYMIFTGESVSAARAVCMLVMTIIADVRARTYDMLTALAMASVMQIMDNPYIICNTSYIMSFFAMLGIALVLPVISSADKTLVFIKKKNRKNRTLKDEVIYLLCDSLSGCIAIQLMLLPALLYVSYETSFISVILNLIVIPLMPVVIIRGIVSGLVGLVSIKCAWFMAGAAHYVLKLYDISVSYTHLVYLIINTRTIIICIIRIHYYSLLIQAVILHIKHHIIFFINYILNSSCKVLTAITLVQVVNSKHH